MGDPWRLPLCGRAAAIDQRRQTHEQTDRQTDRQTVGQQHCTGLCGGGINEVFMVCYRNIYKTV